MNIEGYNKVNNNDQIAALIKMWNLGTPIDVQGFLDRTDIPKDARKRVSAEGKKARAGASTTEAADAYRLMQAQIILEVARLDKQIWRPFGAPTE